MFNPPRIPRGNAHLFASIGCLDPKSGTIYTYLTETFPLRPIDSMITIFILYNWTSNAIHAKPVTSTKDKTLVVIFKSKVDYLAKQGFKLTFNILNNIMSALILPASH